MFSMRRLPSSTAVDPSSPRTPPREAAMLPDADRRKLRYHLETCETKSQEALPFLAHVLRHKITSSEPLGCEVPDDVVTGGCCVSYAIDGGRARTGLLLHRSRKGSGSGVIPVSSLLGATLIGMRVGKRAPLLCSDGRIVALTVLKVSRLV